MIIRAVSKFQLDKNDNANLKSHG